LLFSKLCVQTLITRRASCLPKKQPDPWKADAPTELMDAAGPAFPPKSR
jgi:hypothetical protein